MASAGVESVINDLQNLADRSPNDLEILQRFFKTGKGEYGEGDVFIGVRMPTIRKICKNYTSLGLSEIDELLQSPIHEVRMAAVVLMANRAASKSTSPVDKKAIFDLYLARTDRINNWDLVDVSCRDVVGRYLQDKPRDILYKLAKSKNLWDRRIAIVSTWQFIRNSDLDDTFKISELLLGDTQDLIHKAVGWMLREAGKKDRARLLDFLTQYAHVMPRTALRYAIEHLSPQDRAHFLAQKGLKNA